MTRYAVLSTYPPTRCGIATFTESLATALVEPGGPPVQIVRVLDTAEARPTVPWRSRTVICGELVGDDPSTIAAAIARLNAADVAIVQHEYGIYSGPDGDQVLAVLEALVVPTLVVLHTVLQSPTETQRTLLTRIAGIATMVVVMTDAARDLLTTRYSVPVEHVRVIPHGVDKIAAPAVVPSRPNTRPRVLTWGLIGPGKGIEWGIEAMALVRQRVPNAEYVVAGQTHPKVLAQSGDAYRFMLQASIDRLELVDSVRLDPRYLESADLRELVASADVVLLPYDSLEQVTSGVLVEAVAAGIPVVATGFPHATELLAGGIGHLVTHRDPASMAEAITEVLTKPSSVHRVAVTAVSRASSWSEVAVSYRELSRLVRTSAAA